MGSLANQVALVACLERYERAEQLAKWFPSLDWLGREADRRHDHLVSASILCGFEPGRTDSFTSTLDWARLRVETISRVFPKTIEEHRRAA